MAKPKVISSKVAKKAGTKVSKKSVPKKKVVAKNTPTKVAKKTVKKTNKNSTKVTKKKVAKQKKVVSEKSVKTDLKQKAENKFLSRVQVVPDKTTLDTAVLPENISLRAQSKASAIASLVFEDFSEPARKIAYTAGLCFVLFGAVVSITNNVSISALTSPAQVISAKETSTYTSSTTKITNTIADSVPKVLSLPTVPPELKDDADFVFTVSAGAKAEVYLEDVATLQRRSLEVTSLLNDRYRFFIVTTELQLGKYRLKTKLTSPNGTQFSIEDIGIFSVKETVIAAASSSSTTQEVIEPEETPVETIQNEDPVQEREVITPTATSTPRQQSIIVKAFVSEFTAPNTIQVQAPETASKVTLFLRKNLATTLTPLGRAILSSDKWLYLFDPVNTPDGVYEVIAKVEIDGKVLTSEPAQIVVNAHSSQIQRTAPLTIVESEVTDSEVVSPPVRPLTTLGELNENEVPTNYDEEARTILQASKAALDILLRNYAVARQSGDAILVRIAREELEKKQREFSDNLLRNADSTDLTADDIATALDERLARTIRKVDIFEDLRRNASENDTAVDADNDGVSDFDEVNLFGTDPKSADSDGDGVTDGVEIARGFNPLDSNLEAIVRYESPRESLAFVAEDTLEVTGVSPIVRFDESKQKPPVQAEIRGRGIPNSFVTLYIFSTPTVVTVKTDSDGSFVYTFENELEDGEHEVYVAVTDNTGEIVAQSNPFRFVKEAQAFVSDDGEQITPVTAAIDTTISENPYAAVVGMGVLALGLILLMLGLSLKSTSREEPLIITEQSAT